MITSSPGDKLASNVAISSAAVQECVNKVRGIFKRLSIEDSHDLV